MEFYKIWGTGEQDSEFSRESGKVSLHPVHLQGNMAAKTPSCQALDKAMEFGQEDVT